MSAVAPTEVNRKLGALEQQFVDDVLRVLEEAGLSKEQCQQRITSVTTGAWTQLDYKIKVGLRRRRRGDT